MKKFLSDDRCQFPVSEFINQWLQDLFPILLRYGACVLVGNAPLFIDDEGFRYAVNAPVNPDPTIDVGTRTRVWVP